MSTFNIIDFYNSGAQVQIPARGGGNMRTNFTAGGGGGGDPVEIGYEPRGNAKLAEGASYDELEHGGKRYLLLKGGYVYDVKVGDDEHVISAEEGHISLSLPKDAEIEVDEHDDAAKTEDAAKSEED